jgi:hypothetical protein
MVAATGAGKSSVINAILGDNIVPTSQSSNTLPIPSVDTHIGGMRACTATGKDLPSISAIIGVGLKLVHSD